MKQEISYDKTTKKIYKLPCQQCSGKTNHVVLSSIEQHWTNDENDIEEWDNFEIIGCRGCNDISFRRTSSCTEDQIFNEQIGEIILPETEKLFPNRVIGRQQIKELYLIPPEVVRIYKETHDALCAGLNILAGVGIRILIESICRRKKAQGKNLKIKINNLVSKGVLTQKGASILHKTRLLGNKTAHKGSPPPDDHLNVAIDIVENLLQTVYIIPNKTKKLKKI